MLLKIHPLNPEPAKIAMVIKCLLEGGVIVYATDTVYSYGCDILQSKAFEKIARLKSIRTDKADFSLVCEDLSALAAYCRPIENHIFKMMKSLLPGPYTFILDGGRNIPKIFSERKKTVGIRVPDHEVPRVIVATLGRPIIASSVHDEDSLMEYTTDPGLIHDKLKHEVDIVIDSGISGLVPSTVINCTKGAVEIVRKGKKWEKAEEWV